MNRSILIADDDASSRLLLKAVLQKQGFEVEACADGEAALQALQRTEPPPMAVLDWMMPRFSGPEVCRKARKFHPKKPIYIVMLTARDNKTDVVEGLEAGADDYIIKPFDSNELLARVHVGERVLQLQTELAARVQELEEALTQVKQLSGLLPICSYCKKIRDDKNYWSEVETYIRRHADVRFSHSVCPECYTSIIKPQLEQMMQNQALHDQQSKAR